MTLWTPSNLTDGSLELWWDANNAGSLSLTGSNVNSWTDLVHGVVALSAATLPTYVTGSLNGLPGINFPGSPTSGMTATTTWAPFNSTVSCFAVLNYTNASLYQGIFGETYGSVGSGSSRLGFGIANAGGSSSSPIATFQYQVSDFDSTQTVTAATATMCEWIAAAAPATGAWATTPYVNGTLGGVISASISAWAAQTGIWIGFDPAEGAATGWKGPIYEIVVLNTQSSTATRQIIEGYLAWKWGLQASLPGGHPYSSAAPQVLMQPNPFVNKWILR